jgi:hypothetical protein
VRRHGRTTPVYLQGGPPLEAFLARLRAGGRPAREGVAVILDFDRLPPRPPRHSIPSITATVRFANCGSVLRVALTLRSAQGQ